MNQFDAKHLANVTFHVSKDTLNNNIKKFNEKVYQQWNDFYPLNIDLDSLKPCECYEHCFDPTSYNIYSKLRMNDVTKNDFEYLIEHVCKDVTDNNNNNIAPICDGSLVFTEFKKCQKNVLYSNKDRFKMLNMTE